MIPFVALLAVLAVGSSGELSEFTTSSTDFTFRFLQRAYTPTENAILSPVSIQSSLAMFYPLAGPAVSPDMQRHLNLPADKTIATDNLRRFFASISKQQARPDALKVLSKVYHVDAELNPEVLPLFQGQFGAEVETANFQDQETVVRSVNEWVDRSTGGLIPNYMEPGELRVDTDLMLLNVVALNASWQDPFDPEETEESDFQFLNGVRKVQMMHVAGEFQFGVVNEHNCYAVELNYEEDTDLSMVLILPKKKHTLQDIIQGLSLDLYRALDESLHKVRVAVAIPKFTMPKKLDAKELLMNMGLKSIFENLDFDLLTKYKSKIGEVRQTGFIRVDEKGTEAAAATDVQAVGRSSIPTFYANRPFLYLIRKRSTKDIIFIGHYSVFEEQQ
ncbi:leukocyte elastase inhibitor [Culex quinquefasciatus]|uniref:leukocyte elastase inhibitor n=1 Tax=Culex quinquefasciatus TaxID=7176 RepID=UPI0018E35395|nr:leukocyte elastase inhibitor [Culex quinquefasciatus]